LATSYHRVSVEHKCSLLVTLIDTFFISSIDESFQLPKGWALKENQVFGGKGSGKRMTKKVKSLLERFFLNGNMNPRDKLTAQEMHDELLKYVESKEIEE
jgi:hypothetical protein